jgi:hypothetical protein
MRLHESRSRSKDAATTSAQVDVTSLNKLNDFR